jgi:hypothetical protein
MHDQDKTGYAITNLVYCLSLWWMCFLSSITCYMVHKFSSPEVWWFFGNARDFLIWGWSWCYDTCYWMYAQSIACFLVGIIHLWGPIYTFFGVIAQALNLLNACFLPFPRSSSHVFALWQTLGLGIYMDILEITNTNKFSANTNHPQPWPSIVYDWTTR